MTDCSRRHLRKIRRFTAAASLLLTALACLEAAAQADSRLIGEWMLILENAPADLQGLLAIESSDTGIAAYVEGGPIEISVSGDAVEMRIDSRDAGARRFERVLTGEVETASGGEITLNGTFVSTAVGSENAPPRNWRATRYVPEDTSMLSPAPVDLSGMWNGGSGVDMRKYSMDTKAQAEAWTESYDPGMDQPVLRCLSPGIVQLFGYVYPVEILHTDDRILIINEAYSQVRQIFLDGRTAPDYYPLSRLGFSVGHWEGDTLVVNTTRIRGNIRDFRGEPLSDSTTVEERYRLSDDGQFLYSTMVVNDPENYRRSPIRRIRRARANDTVMLPYECDPDSFFRQLYMEGKMEAYWSRSASRL